MPPQPPSTPITLVSVGEPQSENGTVYFRASFKRGIMGLPTHRTFYGKQKDASAPIIWDRVSPEELRACIGQDVSGELTLEVAEIEPHEFVSQTTGKRFTVSTQVLVRFLDETPEQAIRRYGFKPRQVTSASPVLPQNVPANGFANGHAASLS
jgi:hypothetical protein